IARRFEQHARRDLPGEAPLVLAPTAGAFRTAVFRDGVPVAIGFFLVLRDHHEADRLVGLEIRSAVQADEWPAEHRELHGQLLAFLAAREFGRRGVNRSHLRVREHGGIELGGLTGLAFIEPEARREIWVGHYFSLRGMQDTRRPCPSESSGARSAPRSDPTRRTVMFQIG